MDSLKNFKRWDRFKVKVRVALLGRRCSKNSTRQKMTAHPFTKMEYVLPSGILGILCYNLIGLSSDLFLS
jgi:hypothetical protein